MKTVGGRHYVHLSAVAQLGPQAQNAVKAALKLAKEAGSMGDPDIVSIAAGTNPYPVSLAWVDDFDGKPEPATVQTASTQGDGKVQIRLAGENPQIYHGKEMLVDLDYQGFDKVAAADRRYRYMALNPDPLRMGRQNWWTSWCADHQI